MRSPELRWRVGPGGGSREGEEIPRPSFGRSEGKRANTLPNAQIEGEVKRKC